MTLWHPISPLSGVIILLITLAYDLYTDTRPDVLVNHVRGWWLRLIGFIPAFILMGPWSAPLVFTYWMLMDTGWGLIKGLGPFYIGTTATLDKLQRKYEALQILKYALGIGATFLYQLMQSK